MPDLILLLAILALAGYGLFFDRTAWARDKSAAIVVVIVAVTYVLGIWHR